MPLSSHLQDDTIQQFEQEDNPVSSAAVAHNEQEERKKDMEKETIYEGAMGLNWTIALCSCCEVGSHHYEAPLDSST